MSHASRLATVLCVLGHRVVMAEGSSFSVVNFDEFEVLDWVFFGSAIALLLGAIIGVCIAIRVAKKRKEKRKIKDEKKMKKRLKKLEKEAAAQRDKDREKHMYEMTPDPEYYPNGLEKPEGVDPVTAAQMLDPIFDPESVDWRIASRKPIKPTPKPKPD